MRVEANGHGVVTDDDLNSEERADEFLLMGLRLAECIDPNAIRPYPAAPSTRAGSPAARGRRHRGARLQAARRDGFRCLTRWLRISQ
jgi:hypothetical protein